jgi:hypothetical protein
MARGPRVMVREKAWLVVWRAESVTVTVKDEAVGVAGTPEITPAELRVRRGGKAPELTCHP